MRKRLTKDERREEILTAALHLSKKHSYLSVTRGQIADHIGVASSLIMYHFKTMPQLRRDIMRAAIRNHVPEVIAQGLAAKDPRAIKAPDNLKEAAIQLLSER